MIQLDAVQTVAFAGLTLFGARKPVQCL